MLLDFRASGRIGRIREPAVPMESCRKSNPERFVLHGWETNEVEAGGHAVSRTPLVSLVVFSLLGFSGCAGISRRLDWSSPSTASAAAAETPAPIRFSWWRPPQADALTTDPVGDLAQANRADPPAAPATISGDVWPEPRMDWMVRYFPRLSRLWKGSSTGNSHDAELGSEMVDVSSRSRPAAPSRTGQADDDVRPVDASAEDDVASHKGPVAAGERERFMPPIVPTPLLVPSRPYTVLEPASDVELDVSSVDPARIGQAPSDGLASSVNQREHASSASVTSSSVLATASADDSQTEPPVETPADSEPASESASIVNPQREMELAHAPAGPTPGAQPPPTVPPAPPLNRTPPPPPLTNDEKPATKPVQPEAPTAPNVADEPKPDQTQDATPQPSPVPPATEVPQAPASQAPTAATPVSAQTQASSPAVGQRLVAGSGQSGYASPPPMAPAQPRRRFLSLFSAEQKKEPLASPQFPPATFPPSYYRPYPRPYPVLAAPQAADVKPLVATVTAKKACVLTVWFQKISSSSRALSCARCDHEDSGPCCAGCTCYAGKSKLIRPSPQASLASPQGDLPSRRGTLSQAEPNGSTGAKPGDVAEEGKLFERVSFDSFDKSPQS
jgi:hypothetical protein